MYLLSPTRYARLTSDLNEVSSVALERLLKHRNNECDEVPL